MRLCRLKRSRTAVLPEQVTSPKVKDVVDILDVRFLDMRKQASLRAVEPTLATRDRKSRMKAGGKVDPAAFSNHRAKKSTPAGSETVDDVQLERRSLLSY